MFKNLQLGKVAREPVLYAAAVAIVLFFGADAADVAGRVGVNGAVVDAVVAAILAFVARGRVSPVE